MFMLFPKYFELNIKYNITISFDYLLTLYWYAKGFIITKFRSNNSLMIVNKIGDTESKIKIFFPLYLTTTLLYI